jgi:hypothetical protein
MKPRYTRLRLVLLSLLVVSAFGAMASASASAAELPGAGPWWHVNGVKLSEGVKKETTGKFGKSLTIYSKLGTEPTMWQCTTGNVTAGSIDNGKEFGEYHGKLEPVGCRVFTKSGEEYREVIGCAVTARAIEVKGSLWYHETSAKEETSKIQLLLEPASGTNLIVFVAGKGCSWLTGEWAVTGDVAAEAKPENGEEAVGRLIFPAEQQRHVWRPRGTPREMEVPKLYLGGIEGEASLEGEETGELAGKERFGVFGGNEAFKGPSWLIGGARLEQGKTQSAENEGTLSITTAAVSVTCTGYTPAVKLIGSNHENVGTYEAEIKQDNACKAYKPKTTEEIKACTVTLMKGSTTAKGELVLLGDLREAGDLVSIATKIKFEGASCPKTGEQELKGTILLTLGKYNTKGEFIEGLSGEGFEVLGFKSQQAQDKSGWKWVPSTETYKEVKAKLELEKEAVTTAGWTEKWYDTESTFGWLNS